MENLVPVHWMKTDVPQTMLARQKTWAQHKELGFPRETEDLTKFQYLMNLNLIHHMRWDLD
jgi:hypothetical protein